MLCDEGGGIIQDPAAFENSNVWLFRPILAKVMPAISSKAAAMLQTTIAFTMQKGSNGYNVIPQEDM